eukprot:CAMPEP_0184492484 /NCGR_PEP_ID=MMETSP0113_2-20130426/23387_1 /TAXON_ID=91329 /ORGANISM="Norrisiella sphaerica, Strain BC52" /LENGTH=343 /DNA_ID=CAMNT_0026877311 /DNA_START=58 /DNA_END=1089 /DNA_ORIENTATION=-
MSLANVSKLKAFCSRIPGAAIVRLRGSDSHKFLQDKTTNDVTNLADGEAQYTAWLNRKGRFLHSSILFKSHMADEYYLVCEESTVSHLLKHIRLFKFRSKVEVDDVSKQFQALGVVSRQKALLEEVVESNSRSPSLASLDPRAPPDNTRVPPMGAIVIQPVEEKFKSPGEITEVDSIVYDAYRITQGIPRDGLDLFREDSFILEANYDWLSGVSFTKGCYLGQELTARSHHTGKIRKRLMPVRFVPMDSDTNEKNYERIELSDNLFPSFFDAEHSSTTPDLKCALKADSKSAGKIFGCVNNVGIAQVRSGNTNENTVFEADHVQGIRVIPYIPEWWPEQDLAA